MDGRIIAIGGSAGAIDALRTILPAFPRDFQTPILIVVHMYPDRESVLAEILDRRASLTVVSAEDGMTAEGGHAYLAPPDHHLFVDAPGRIRVLQGPRENRHRPAVDTLFRSVGRVYGAASAGVILSGALDDGSAGLAYLRRNGAAAVVQDPDEAVVRGMPEAALHAVPDAMRFPAGKLAPALIDIARRLPSLDTSTPPIHIASNGILDAWKLESQRGSPSQFSCPECNGLLFELDDAGGARYRCRTGHGYSPQTLAADQTDNVERVLWSAARALQERADLYSKLAHRFDKAGSERMAQRAREQARQDLADAEEVRRMLVKTET